MRLRALLLFAVIPLASPAAARGIVIEPAPLAPGRTVVVSWEVPAAYEESELLVEVDGGPRVRLSNEQGARSPSVHVRLPSLVGTARFVVRAGRTGPDGKRREEDLDRSERFPLAFDPSWSGVAPPVLAASTRPDLGEEMEWWEEEAAGSLHWPVSGMGSPSRPRIGEGSSSSPSLPSFRSGDGPSPGEETLPALAGPTATRPQAVPAPREPVFRGAPVPLRN